MMRYLILAHQTASAPELVEHVARIARSEPEAVFTLVVPATPVRYLPSWSGGTAVDAAEAQLWSARNELVAAGARVDRTVVGSGSPLVALEDELRGDLSYHAIIIATLPPGLSRWLKLDLVSQARRRFHLPVVHVVAQPPRVSVETPGQAGFEYQAATPGERIEALLRQLESPDGTLRRQARVALADAGRAVVPRLAALLKHADPDVRWEAARLLVDVHDERAIPALVDALEDEAYGVRWLAAEALAGIGEAALLPLLRRSLQGPSRTWLLQGLHHVCRSLTQEADAHYLDEVVAALDRGYDSVAWLPVVDRVLRQIEQESAGAPASA